MMKRFWCLMLCLTLSLTTMTALAAEEYTLPEKLRMQIEFGNGVKGAMMLTASGESALTQMLSVLNGTEIQIRGIMQDGSYQTSFYTLDGDTQLGLTQLYGDSENLYLRTDMLPELLLRYPLGEDWLERLAGREEGDNPTWYSAAASLLALTDEEWEQSWTPALNAYSTALELWLSEYAATPVVGQGKQGETLMTVRYAVPVDAVKAELKALLAQVLTDETLLSLLREHVTEEQADVYLTPGFLYYYEAIMDALPLAGEVVLERDMSTRGESISTAISLPLPAGFGWQTLTLEQDGQDTTFSLTGEASDVTLVMKTAQSTANSARYAGMLRVEQEDKQGLAVAFTLKKVYTHTVDADTREHDVTTWSLELAMDEAVVGDEDYITFEPVQASLMTHFHSKNAKRNATTLELTASLAQGTESLSLAGSIKTTSPWVLDTLPTQGAEELTAMTASYRAEIMGMLWENLRSLLSALHPDELPVPGMNDDVPDASAGDDGLATHTDMIASSTDLPVQITAIVVENAATTTELTADTAAQTAP
ncbi:MAG: hypothetical protein ACI4MJ_12605 [Aristaeellaceae bacterium]